MEGRNIEASALLLLPTEIRLKIYAYILPPRRHSIVTQTSYTGFYYNTSSSLGENYVFGKKPPKPSKEYKILTANSYPDFPNATIHTAILRTCSQIRSEAEPILYSGRNVQWDHAVHLEAAKTFWSRRSQLARESVKSIQISRDILCADSNDVGSRLDPQWADFCAFLSTSLPNIRKVDLKLWRLDANVAKFPIPMQHPAPHLEDFKTQYDTLQPWQNWEWTKDLVNLPNVRQLALTCWEFGPQSWMLDKHMNRRFTTWLADRMGESHGGTVRTKMLQDECVLERVFVLTDLGHD